MPLRVNYAGVMPIIFAQAILMFPSMIFLKLGQLADIKFFVDIGRDLSRGNLLYYLVYAGMIMFFSYFWVATQFNELQIADDLEEIWRLHPGCQAGSGNQRFSASSHEPHHLGGCSVSDSDRGDPDADGQVFGINFNCITVLWRH